MRSSIGKISLPLIISVIGFFIVLLVNLRINLLSTSLIRGVFTFVIFYSIGTILNLILSFEKTDNINVEKGTKIQMETPTDDLNKLMNEIYQTKADDEDPEQDSDFKPMEFKKIKIDGD